MAKDFIFPPQTRYTCINCGRCCMHWAVKVDDAVAEKLLKVDWASKYPEIAGGDIFVRRKTGVTEGLAYFMRMRQTGRCPFLHENNYCRIHTDISYDAKPAGCKLFPLSMAEGPKGIHVRESYYCPAVASNEGKALSAQTRWISQCYRESGAQSLGETFYLAEGIQLKWPDVLLIESTLLKMLRDGSMPMSHRLLMGGEMVERLIENAMSDDKFRVGNLLRDFEKLGFEPLEGYVDKPAASPFRGRLALALFLIQDSKPTTRARIMRIPGMARFLFKLGALKSHLLGSKASLGKIGKIEFNPGEEGNELLFRFFEQKIIGKRYIEGDLTIEGGWALLCAAYKLIELFSKLRAAAAGGPAVSFEDIKASAGVADLLVVEHTVFFQMDMTRKLVHVVLGQPGMYRNVLGAI